MSDWGQLAPGAARGSSEQLGAAQRSRNTKGEVEVAHNADCRGHGEPGKLIRRPHPQVSSAQDPSLLHGYRPMSMVFMASFYLDFLCT